uniref:Uncharacterized protein n=1 Tax=Trichobilharzia regenti TaxID=157069 RepID=A0AA85IPM9_TRIRE|nr:unnamed protein product [Trichobilharzia regenti]
MRFAYITLVLLVSLFAVVENDNGQASTSNGSQMNNQPKSIWDSIWTWLNGIFKFFCSMGTLIDIFYKPKGT